MHYADVNRRFNKFGSGTRLTGAQAILLARYCLRLVDGLKDKNDFAYQKTRIAALSKICQTLGTIGTIINSMTTSCATVHKLNELCTKYFNLFSLFFKEVCNSTVWTMGYAVLFSAQILYDKYNVGYGIISMQGKEAKHSALKNDLKMSTNRSCSQDEKGKWHQVARGSFVRNFYLPYHFLLETYVSQSDLRNPPVKGNACACFRCLPDDENICEECITTIDLDDCVRNGVLSEYIKSVIKPIQCESCNERFSDIICANEHNSKCTKSAITEIIQKNLKLEELKRQLSARGISTSGNKAILCERLELNLHN